MPQCILKKQSKKKLLQTYIKVTLLFGAVVFHGCQNLKYVIFIKPRNFDTADIKCLLYLFGYRR